MSPCRAKAPSWKWTPRISVSTRVLTATLAIGVTEPSKSTRTGTRFLTAVATSTGTLRSPCPRGACATAPCGDQGFQFAGNTPDFAPTTAAKASSPATPSTKFRFFIVAVEPGSAPTRAPSVQSPPQRQLFFLLLHEPLPYRSRQCTPT